MYLSLGLLLTKCSTSQQLHYKILNSLLEVDFSGSNHGYPSGDKLLKIRDDTNKDYIYDTIVYLHWELINNMAEDVAYYLCIRLKGLNLNLNDVILKLYFPGAVN